MKCNDLTIDSDVERTMSLHEDDGHTVVLIGINGKKIRN